MTDDDRPTEDDGADDRPDDDRPTEDDPDAESAPLDDLAREVRERRARREARDDDAVDDPAFDPADAEEIDEYLFESVDVAAVDSEAVWESFVADDGDSESSLGVGVEATTVGTDEEHVVPKREYCQRCPHFTAPPETACTHEGTTIVEVVGSDEFRVRNCPMVEGDGTAPTFE